LVLVAVGVPSPAASQSATSSVPPKAGDVPGQIELVEIGPVFAERFVCAEHVSGELDYAGDALGTDCMVLGHSDEGLPQLYRTNGRRNEDWYGWKTKVLAPFDGVVIFAEDQGRVNTPGTLGPNPAGSLRFQNADGIVVIYAHLVDARVSVGDSVAAGQVVGAVGNNGQSRAPHIHVGAFRRAGSVPLQIRWDLRAMAKARLPGR